MNRKCRGCDNPGSIQTALQKVSPRFLRQWVQRNNHKFCLICLANLYAGIDKREREESLSRRSA